jgi:long-subunit acyl-CoA synthetase (AMP-forming)
LKTTKYNKIADLISDFANIDGNAFLFGDPKFPDGIGFLSYQDLQKLILSESLKIKTSGNKVDFIKIRHDPADIIHLFADLIAGTDAVLLDPQLPEIRQISIKTGLKGVLERLHEKRPEGQEGRVIFFTSGTTSSSRAVVLTTEALLHAAWRGQMCLPISEEDILLSVLPLSHVFGFVCSFLWGITNGASIALGRGLRHITDDPNFFHPTYISLVPRMAEVYARFNSFNPELKTILIGAAPLSDSSREMIRKATKALIYTGYGLTETASGVAITTDGNGKSALTICPGVDIKLADDGEIMVKTDSLLEAYVSPGSVLKNGSEDSLPINNQGFFMTGDIGIFDPNGLLHVTGRKKDMLVLPDGKKLFCPEYESILTKGLGTDELAIILMDGRPKLVVSNQADKDKVNEAVNSLNMSLSRSLKITDVIYINKKLPRTITGKLKRYLIEQALSKGDFSIWKD